MNITVAQRRFDSIPKGDPEAVVPLPKGHPALVGMRTLFPSTVVDAKDSPRLLVSGVNNRKIGKQVAFQADVVMAECRYEIADSLDAATRILADYGAIRMAARAA